MTMSNDVQDQVAEAICRVVHPHLWYETDPESCDRCDCAASAAAEELRRTVRL